MKAICNQDIMIIEQGNAGQYVEVIVPLLVLDDVARNPFQSGDRNVEQLISLQKILLEEDRAVYLNQVKSCGTNSMGALLATSEYEQHLAHFFEFSSLPLLNSMEETLLRNKMKIEQLTQIMNS